MAREPMTTLREWVIRFWATLRRNQAAALACVGPARRAARIDPIRALRPD